MLRAICYALFGAKALNESLEETVTWGEDLKTLKVELELSIDGVVYAIKRGKSGAEINYDGGIVTGQTETTSFLCRLLKVDAGAASRLMLANQNEIRGALESGTKATTELIEKLAEFSQLDSLLDRMQENLALGTTGNVEAQIAHATTALVEAEVLAVPPETVVLQADIDIAQNNILLAENDQSIATTKVDAAKEALTLAESRAAARSSLVREERKAQARKQEVEEKLEKLAQVEAPVNPNARIEQLRKDMATAEASAGLTKIHDSVQALFKPRMTDFVWAGSGEDLSEALGKLDRSNRADGVEQARLDGQINLLRQQLLQGSCTFCGKDFSGVPEVITKNSEVQQKLDQVLVLRDQIKVRLGTSLPLAESKRNCEMSSRPALAALGRYEGLLEATDGFLPPVLRWVGDTPGTSTNTAVIRFQIDEIEANQIQFTKAEAAAGPLLEELARLILSLGELDEKFKASPEVDLTEMQADLKREKELLSGAVSLLAATQGTLRSAQRLLEDAVAAHERAKAQVAANKLALATKKEELKTLVFNNALLKKVRSARPLIADKLWQLLMSAVNNYFSEIRGTPSEVTKEADGFKVDGHPSTTLSGSTLDALGLAIRVALVRTFLPSSTFLVLDEPSSGMDSGRTSNMLGFLQSVGFQQVLIASHDPMSESVSDNVIYLG